MYVLIHQNKKFLEVFKRNTGGTWQYAILEETGTLEFSCLDFSMTLEEIYEDVKLEKG
jgi:Uma2 family endonuclease